MKKIIFLTLLLGVALAANLRSLETADDIFLGEEQFPGFISLNS